MLWIIVFLLVIIVALLGGGPVLSVIVGVVGLGFCVLMIVWVFSTEPVVGFIALAAAVFGLLVFAAHVFGREKDDKWLVPDGTRLKNRRRISESEEVEPGIYKHRDGCFIARGPRGGYCAYTTIEAARLYRDKGPRAAKGAQTAT